MTPPDNRRPAQAGTSATPAFKAPGTAKPARAPANQKPDIAAPPPKPTDDFIAANQPAVTPHDPVPVIGEPCDPQVQIHEAVEAALKYLKEGHPATAKRHLEALRFWASQGIPEAIMALNELTRQFADLPAPEPAETAAAPAAEPRKAARRGGGSGTRAPKTSVKPPAPPPPQEGDLTPTLARTGPHEPAIHAHAAVPELTEEN